jgi:hypothetical protein
LLFCAAGCQHVAITLTFTAVKAAVGMPVAGWCLRSRAVHGVLLGCVLSCCGHPASMSPSVIVRTWPTGRGPHQADRAEECSSSPGASGVHVHQQRHPYHDDSQPVESHVRGVLHPANPPGCRAGRGGFEVHASKWPVSYFITCVQKCVASTALYRHPRSQREKHAAGDVLRCGLTWCNAGCQGFKGIDAVYPPVSPLHVCDVPYCNAHRTAVYNRMHGGECERRHVGC